MDSALVSVLTIVGTGIAAYVGSYLKVKGKTLARKEDLDNILKEVHAVTQTTKEIEAKISSEMWDRQKHWELKRDLLFSAMKNVTGCDVALQKFDERHERGEEDWLSAARKLDETNLLIAVMCSSEMNSAYDDYVVFANSIAEKIFQGGKQIYAPSEKSLEGKLAIARAAVRKELGIGR